MEYHDLSEFENEMIEQNMERARDREDWETYREIKAKVEAREMQQYVDNLEPKEALEYLIEELMWSKNGIAKDKILCYLKVLAAHLHVKNDGWHEEDLKIEHYKDKYRLEQQAREHFEPRIQRIKIAMRDLNEELSGTGQIRTERAQGAINDINSDLCLEKVKINVERKEKISNEPFYVREGTIPLESNGKIIRGWASV